MTCNPRYHMISRDLLQQRLLQSTCNVFTVMADIALEECSDGPDEQQEHWVTAMVGFEGTYSGLVVLHCPEPLARRIAAGLVCSDADMHVQEVHDAMGEVVNILGGDIKLLMDNGGRHVHMSIPSVFKGDGTFHSEFMTVPDTVTFTLSTGDERLLVGVHICRGE